MNSKQCFMRHALMCKYTLLDHKNTFECTNNYSSIGNENKTKNALASIHLYRGKKVLTLAINNDIIIKRIYSI